MSQEESNRTLTTVIYGLQAASFFVGVTAIAAIIMNYVKRSDVAGTWMSSHFRWQIRTFWWGLLWSIIGIATTPFLVGFPILAASAIWFAYRVIKGWLRLNDNKEMYLKY